MIVFHDVKDKLKKAGYSTYRLKKENIFPGSVITRISNGEEISLQTVDTICQLTGLPICQIVTIEIDPKESENG